ncbi:uncharacterized protein LOC143231880 [Tachypleus tridentatus]|uniref:uncharacterized protein LOC143231880 n=1 Tax=Tachypleus tridentatus TaxID=6853 RepID=UPI003FD07F0D
MCPRILVIIYLALTTIVVFSKPVQDLARKKYGINSADKLTMPVFKKDKTSDGTYEILKQVPYFEKNTMMSRAGVFDSCIMGNDGLRFKRAPQGPQVGTLHCYSIWRNILRKYNY